MKPTLFFLLFVFPLTSPLVSQKIHSEEFESLNLPPGWTIETNATDGGWQFGSFTDLSSQFWTIPVNGSIGIAATNDDRCNCNKRNDFLISPPLDLTAVTSAALSVQVFFGAGNYQGFTEDASIEISLNGDDWSVLKQLPGFSGWRQHRIDLSAYAGQDTVYIAFHYNDNGGWLFGLAIDNFLVDVPLDLDARMEKLHLLPYGEENSVIQIKGELYNNGLSPLTSVGIAYEVNGEGVISAMLEGINIPAFSFFEFVHPVDWQPAVQGVYELKVEIQEVNSTMDEDPTNNSLSFVTEIFPKIVPPNRIDEFLFSEPVFTTIADVTKGLDKPTDLDFFPILAKNELWVINERTENTGGSTLTIYDAGEETQSFLNRVDGNAWHFMSLPTAIAFSNNFNFGTSPGVKDANHNNGTFTGPTLWSSDPEIYAQPSGGNGSHLDMLHGSPYSMGIASEKENIFWVFDGWNQTIVRYDFQEDHGPGNDDHSDAIVRRYSEIQVKRDGFIPSHLVLDQKTGWLYIVDNGNDRILRLDIHSGIIGSALPLINEPLAEHSQMAGVTWEVIIQDSLDQPSGIDLFENRLLVSDYATGDIIVFDVDNDFAELGRINTGAPGITGLKIGPDGAIWYTKRLENSLTKILPGESTSTVDGQGRYDIRIFPNPTSDLLFVDVPGVDGSSGSSLILNDVTGKQIDVIHHAQGMQQLNLNRLPAGIYTLSVSNGDCFITRKIVLNP